MGTGQNCKVFSDVLEVKYVPGILFAVANASDITSTQGEANLITFGILPNIEVLTVPP
jgi:hypothetical protein